MIQLMLFDTPNKSLVKLRCFVNFGSYVYFMLQALDNIATLFSNALRVGPDASQLLIFVDVMCFQVKKDGCV